MDFHQIYQAHAPAVHRFAVGLTGNRALADDLTADAFVRLGTYRCVLVVGQEVQSTRMDVTTRGRGTAVIFADGAGAVVLAPQEGDDRGLEEGAEGRRRALPRDG